jgi:putative DNA methylase
MTAKTVEATNETSARGRATPLGDLCFIETQFPVSKMSKESYTERKAVAGQTLTGLGKWWGRKPLVLCRATILGLLLPATDDPARDREVFLRLMTMDADGMLQRKSKSIPAAELFRHLPPSDRTRYFEPGVPENKATLKKDLTREAKEELQRRVFLSLSYDERLEFCARPEQIDGPSPESWQVINAYLGTQASSLPELVTELGRRRFGHVPRVGDSFCGGGSIPFEASRLGCEGYGSDLNPVAALLTWAALHIIGGGRDVVEEVQQAQHEVFDAVDKQVTAWGIEHREPDAKTGRRWRADAYLYCVEATCPECGWRVPLAPSWVIAEKTNVVARLVPDVRRKSFAFEIVEHASAEMGAAANGTARDEGLNCPNPDCRKSTPIRVIRGDGRGSFGESRSLLRGWENSDVVPRQGDIFGERLYCVRWIDRWVDKKGKEHSRRHYLAPTSADLERERRVLALLTERFAEWQRQSTIPTRRIEPGAETARLARERGWTTWHHLFTPRQLLVNGLFSVEARTRQTIQAVAIQLLVGRLADWNSRLCVWLPSNGGGIGGGKNTFLNQAYNTLVNFSVRPITSLRSLAIPARLERCAPSEVDACDGRRVERVCDIWFTDPPYADAVNYPELSEFYLAWYEGLIQAHFPEWSADSKRVLAVSGASDTFSRAMVDCYRPLVEHMPDNGLQVVMFTHQNAAVWADLALILWAAGLRVTAAWCIATETGPAVGEGNYVQGTVLLVLRKQTSDATAFLDEVYPEVEAEVRRQLDSMLALDDAKDPNFSDTDYQLAAYAAALRVLTAKRIEEIDVAYELTRTRARGEASPVEKVIRTAVMIACDHLVPRGIERHLWKSLTALERLYLKGLEMESHGERRNGVYQELARGFGVTEYKSLLASTKANQTRLKTASEFGRKELGVDGFGRTVVRHALFGTFKTAETESPREAMSWFKTEVRDYAVHRQRMMEILEFLGGFRRNASMVHWHKDAEAAAILAGALRNRQDNV